MELAPSLPPLVQAWEEELFNHPWALPQMRELASGPFHVLYPTQLRTNLRDFATTAQDMNVDCTVFFARKANKAECWLQEIAAADQGVDVASGPELVGALAGGIHGTKLVITGAEKADNLLWLGIRHGCTIAADSPGELQRILDITRRETSAHHTDGHTRVLLRILPAEQTESRFGCTPQEWSACISGLPELGKHVDIVGSCFHLNEYSSEQRGKEAHRSLDFMRELRRKGWRADTLDIGGGFSVRYSADADWEAFQPTLTDASAFHAGHTPSTSYPYGGEKATGPEMLRAILNTPTKQVDGQTLAERLRTEGVKLALEPGRALLAGCGLTVFPVQGVKSAETERKSPDLNPQENSHYRYQILTAAGLSMSLSEQWKSSEFLPDPTLWPQREGTPTRACVGGSSCMEYDMLTWRTICFPRAPKRGDLLIYHNTAGYQMDKNESSFHQLPLPSRFVWDSSVPTIRHDHPLHVEL